MHRFFKITRQSQNSRARLGEITTPHGVIQTPVFMPVGTQGTVKAMRPDELAQMGAEIILGNTYHLYLRPGHELIKKQGGLHKFMNWPGPILTDSGGYQVFSLGKDPEDRQGARSDANLNSTRTTKLARITEEGVYFQSHIDGQEHLMTPELSIEIQRALGADILMVFDDCTPYPATLGETRKSMERSLKWEERSLVEFRGGDSGNKNLFAIVQGGMYPELRKECFERLMEMGKFSGFAMGGLSVGEPINQMYELADYTGSLIPNDYPRYLMGVGMPADLVTCVDYGIDLFDCVIPTRNARNGMLFTVDGFIYIKQAQFAEDERPIDPSCVCYTCRNYSRAYLRHLHLAKELLSSVLSTLHNLHYYLNLIRDMRTAIVADRYPEFKKEFLERISS